MDNANIYEPCSGANDGGNGTKKVINARIEHESFDEHVKKQEYQRLKFLLEKTTVYSKFLAEKLKKNEEDAKDLPEATPAQEKKTAQRTGSRRKSESVPVPPSKGPFKQPALVTGGVLRDYQLEGVEWLVSLFENGLNGILADEMGLGKTLQCISFLAFLREQGIWGPFLVVAPLSTIENWVAEIKRFTPDIPVILYHGTQARREEIRNGELKHYGPSFPIVVTSYEIMMNDRKFLQKHYWKYLIVDEGHRIKNLNCKLIKELKAVNTANRLLLTGTPLQNNLSELWSLLNFLLPDIFDDLDSFQSWFDLGDLEDNQMKLLDEDAEISIISNLHTILKPFLLRRLKSDVESSLPPKKEYLIYSTLSQGQHDLYQAVLARRLREHFQEKQPKEKTAHIAEPGKKRRSVVQGQFKEAESDDSFTVTESEDDSEELSTDEAEQFAFQKNTFSGSKSLQNALMQLRKVCNHPYLFERPTDPKTGDFIISEDIVACSGKMKLLDQLLPALIKGGHRVLIFSQMNKMLDILSDYLEYKRIPYCRIDGSVPQTERSDQIKEFREDSSIPVFLLTTRAGGLGINLVSADTVIFYDSDWNPQMDLQAQDRVHRIGQTRPVLIYRFAVANSVETRILERATSKRKLEKLVIHQKKFKGRQQYYKDERILLEDLEDVLQDTDSIPYNEGRTVLTKGDLNFLLDRSEAAFASKESQSQAFKVIREARKEDSLL